jgi:hypothetical protein
MEERAMIFFKSLNGSRQNLLHLFPSLCIQVDWIRIKMVKIQMEQKSITYILSVKSDLPLC